VQIHQCLKKEESEEPNHKKKALSHSEERDHRHLSLGLIIRF
jgi:hypothetical protein